MNNTVKIIECPRDAWQGLPLTIPSEVKAEYLRALVTAGFRQIDAVSFVSSKAVPQMADSEQVLALADLPSLTNDQLEIIGIVAAYFAVRYAEVVPLLGPSGLLRLRLIAPLAMLAHQPELGVPDAAADTIAQVLMYAQFPLYGLLLGILWRAVGFLRAASMVVLLHSLAIAAVMVLSQL